MPGRSLEDMKLLTLKKVAELTGLSASRIAQLEADGRFCRRVLIGDRSVRYRLWQVREWMNAQPLAPKRVRTPPVRRTRKEG